MTTQRTSVSFTPRTQSALHQLQSAHDSLRQALETRLGVSLDSTQTAAKAASTLLDIGASQLEDAVLNYQYEQAALAEDEEDRAFKHATRRRRQQRIEHHYDGGEK